MENTVFQEQEDGNTVPVYHMSYFSIPFNPTGKQIHISDDQGKTDHKQQSWLRFMESETSKILKQRPPTDSDYKGASLF